jgi:small-conductance mechanosensitive channel
MGQRHFLILLVTAIAGGLVACGPSKVDQCNGLSKAVNNVKPIADKFTQSSQAFEKESQTALSTKNFAQFQASLKKYSSGSKSLNQELDGAIKNVDAVDLKDETLVGLKKQYVQASNGLNQGIADLTKSLDKMSQAKLDSPDGVNILQQAGKELDATSNKMSGLVKQENETVSKFNKYCAGK